MNAGTLYALWMSTGPNGGGLVQLEFPFEQLQFLLLAHGFGSVAVALRDPQMRVTAKATPRLAARAGALHVT